MEFLKKTIVVLALLLACVASPLQAQQTTTTTLLTSAINGLSSTVILAVTSSSSMTANQTGFMVDQEYMLVTSVLSTTSVRVLRAQSGTKAMAHSANAVIWFGITGTGGPFISVDKTGQCTPANEPWLPQINTQNGNIYHCILSTTGTTSNWSKTNFVQAGTALPYKKLAVTATTYTALASDYIIGYNTNVAGTITLPALTGLIGKQYIVQIEVTGTQSVTIATSAGQLINGAASAAFGGSGSAAGGTSGGGANFKRILIFFDGISNWFAGQTN